MSYAGELLADRREQEQDEYDRKCDVSAARRCVAEMKAIRQCDRTEHVVAYLLVSVANVLRSSGWSHTMEAEHAIDTLDDLHDYLTKETPWLKR